MSDDWSRGGNAEPWSAQAAGYSWFGPWLGTSTRQRLPNGQKDEVMSKVILAALAATLLLTACPSDADVASENLSTAAEQFEIERRVVFFNGITDTYLLTIEGRCSIEDEGHQLEVTCKIDDDAFKKHFLGLSDNVSYFVEQVEVADVDEYHYRVIFKPETIVPAIDLETSGEDSES